MKKRSLLFVVLITFVLILSSCVLDYNKEHEHVFENEYACLDRVCTECNEMVPATQSHDRYSTYSCKDSYCTICGTNLPALTDHRFDHTYTCLDRYCNICKEKFEATTEHVYNELGKCECGNIEIPEEYLVEFVDFNGNIVETISVVYGDYIELPVLDNPDNVSYKWMIEGSDIIGSFYFFYNSNIQVIAVIEQFDYIYNISTYYCPKDWNPLTNPDPISDQIRNYLQSNLFEFNYKFDEDGNIIPGDYNVEYSAAVNVEDITEYYFTDSSVKHQAYKITLRDDLCWDDGTKITADDFVYTMKELLDPTAKYYNAGKYYNGNVIIKNAKNYNKQGTVETDVDNGQTHEYTLGDLVKRSDDVYMLPNGREVYFNLFRKYSCIDNSIFSYFNNLNNSSYYKLYQTYNSDNIPVTDETIDLFAEMINTDIFGNQTREDVANFLFYDYEYPKMSFDEVGISVGDNQYELIVVLDKPLQLLDDTGNLYHLAAYSFQTLPLVHRTFWQENKVISSNNTVSSKYNTSVETSRSWGPYKIIQYKYNESYTLVKNTEWYGYSDTKYYNQYQTEKIVCKVILNIFDVEEQFLQGKVDHFDVVDSDKDYAYSDRAYYIPDDYVDSIHLQSNKEELEKREYAGINKTILTYPEFRKALSLSINRVEYCKNHFNLYLPGYGLFNNAHYYDIANGGRYRNEDVAKMVLCITYGVDYEKYSSLDEAYEQITKQNLDLARQLVDVAYDKALADGEISENDIVVLQFGASVINSLVSNIFKCIKDSWLELVKGTKLEGKLKFANDLEAGPSWSNEFRAGKYDVTVGGWTGAAWDPAYFLAAYLDPTYMYSSGWATDEITMEFTMPGAGVNGTDITDTLSLLEWYKCLNNLEGAKYNFGEGYISNDLRLLLIAALEKEILTAYYTIPVGNSNTARMISYKVDYITYDYNVFMEFGGVRYLKYNYTESEWHDYVNSCNGNLNYLS